MKRLGIFFFYEKNGDVDDFITYYLADLNKNLTELVVVCNGKLSEQGRAAFSQFTDNIIVRENKGLDVWAYKTALDSYGWAKLSEFDEIVMTNSTLMGPVRPLKEMFDAMWENQDLDFWGLSIHHGAKSNPFKGKHLYNYLPVHIQSHFIVYRQRFVQNPELQAYWDNMPMIESYTDSVQRYEAVFTKQFEDKGFKWDVYVKTDDLKDFTDYPLLVCPTLLLREKKSSGIFDPPVVRFIFLWQSDFTGYLPGGRKNETSGLFRQAVADVLRADMGTPFRGNRDAVLLCRWRAECFDSDIFRIFQVEQERRQDYVPPKILRQQGAVFPAA